MRRRVTDIVAAADGQGDCSRSLKVTNHSGSTLLGVGAEPSVIRMSRDFDEVPLARTLIDLKQMTTELLLLHACKPDDQLMAEADG